MIYICTTYIAFGNQASNAQLLNAQYSAKCSVVNLATAKCPIVKYSNSKCSMVNVQCSVAKYSMAKCSVINVEWLNVQ